MSEPLDFAGNWLEHAGALVERREGLLEAVVPPAVGARLGLPEHALLSGEEVPGMHRVAYGTELLERLVAGATERLPVSSGRIAAGSAREGAAARAVEGFVLRNGIFTAASPRPFSGWRLWLHAAYTLHAEERREGLVSAVVSLAAGTPVEGFEEAALSVLEPAPPGGPGAREAARVARLALECCRVRAEVEAVPLREAMERRFARDRQRLETYFEDLLTELSRRAGRGRVDPAAAGEKRQVLERERAAKLEALAARQGLRLELRPVAALWVQAPAFLVPVELRRRKASRTVELEFDGVTRRRVPLACEACARPAERPAACDERLHLLCETCAPQVEGRIPCAACRRV